MEAALDPAYEQTARWAFNLNTWMRVRALVDNAGRPLILDSAESGIGQPHRRSLLGYPVVIEPAFPTSTTLSARFAVLGNLTEAYTIRRVTDFTMVVNPYSRASFGQVEFVAWERADGNIQARKAFALMQANAV
jgi:HK97 family phage major capsid protein